MIILDTNVLSEATSGSPDARVTAWLDSQFDAIFITAITVGELSFGIAKMPHGRRRTAFADSLVSTLTEDFDGRVLPFDEAAAIEYGRLVAEREASGRPMSKLDAQIAAIAVSHAAVVATRDIRGLEHPEVRVVNPWEA